MGFQRRDLLRVLPYAVGAGFILPRNELVIAAQSSTQMPGAQSSPTPAAPSMPSAPAKADTKHEWKGTKMEKVAGIGGLFFRAHDPKSLGAWYQQHLGVSLTPTGEGAEAWQQEAGPTAFSPFPEATKYFGDANKVWMVNFRVHNLEKMIVQLRAAGIEVKDPESYPGIGSFARLHDPEGNPIELWQPA